MGFVRLEPQEDWLCRT